MRTPQALVSAAWLCYVVAWFLPVAEEGVKFPKGLPGWEAFRVATCAVWPYESFSTNHPVLCLISAASTLVFMPVSVWAVFSGSHALRRVSAWVVTFAFVVNAHFYILSGSERKDFRVGYFLWWFSFLLMAFGLFALSTREAQKSERRNEAAANAL